MDKRTYLLKSLNAEAYRWKRWVYGILAVTQLPTKAEPFVGDINNPNVYPYQLYKTDAGIGFNDPESDKFELLEGVVENEAIFRVNDLVEVLPNEVLSLHEPTTTCVGNLLFNYYVLIYSFGDKFDYINDKVNLSKLEPVICGRLLDGKDNQLLTNEVKRYVESAAAFEGFANLCVPSATPFTLTASKDAIEKMHELYKEYAGKLNDPVIIAKIAAEVEKLDRAYVAQDPDAGFYQSGKEFSVIRMKLLYMAGMEENFDGSGTTFVQNSLTEGWDLTKLPTIVNALRDGSYNRGIETALGGEKAKTILRALAGSMVSMDDCGTKLSKQITLPNSTSYVGQYVNLDDGATLLTMTNYKDLVNTTVGVRSPQYCMASSNHFCKACVGQFIDGNEQSIPSVGSQVGNQMMLFAMKKMHGTSLTTVKLDLLNDLT